MNICFCNSVFCVPASLLGHYGPVANFLGCPTGMPKPPGPSPGPLAGWEEVEPQSLGRRLCKQPCPNPQPPAPFAAEVQKMGEITA